MHYCERFDDLDHCIIRGSYKSTSRTLNIGSLCMARLIPEYNYASKLFDFS